MKRLSPPHAAEKPLKIKVHGEVRVDEYAWLKDKDNAEVLRHIKKENAYADAVMQPTKKLQKQLYSEIRKRMKEDDMSVPVKDGPYLYYTRTKKGKQYAIHCRKPVKGGKEEVILDENALAKGEKYFSIGTFEVSPNHSLLAYTFDVSGNERHTLCIKDLKTGKLRSERIGSVNDVEWSDDMHLFYSVEEHPHPPRRIMLHELGTDSTADTLVYEEKDLKWYAGVGKTADEKYVLIYGGTFDMSEVRLIPALDPHAKPHLIAPRAPKVKYYVEHHDGVFYIMTNERAVNYKIMRADASQPEKRHWKTWLAHRQDRALTGIGIFKDFFIVSLREKGAEEIYVHAPGNPRGSRIKLPEPVHSITVWGDIEYESPFVRFTYQSFVTPKTVFDYEPRTEKLITKKVQPVPRWDPKKYISERIWVKNGRVRIPISLVRSKKVRLNGANPLLLDGYGAYGICSDPYFSISRLPLLERGWVIATAHIRGGGEMGWQWHESAKLLTKHRTYQDFIAAADHLVRKKYTSREKLAIVGGSAGGMMIGAVLNMRPDLCGAAIAYVPAADLITSSFDESLGGTRLHYDETGDPRKPEVYKYFLKYSPYEAVRKAAYPALLVRANMNDIRTPYWEAAKWVARLRAKKTDSKPLLFKTETVAGHFGRSGRYEWIKDRALDYAFLILSVAGIIKR